jgi:hypothetical protein
MRFGDEKTRILGFNLHDSLYPHTQTIESQRQTVVPLRHRSFGNGVFLYCAVFNGQNEI